MHGSKFLTLLALLGLTTGTSGLASARALDGSAGTRGVTVSHPAYGALTRHQHALLGPDTDANGVRDDVDTFITRGFSMTPLTRKAVTAYAKEVTTSMLYPDKVMSDDESSRRLAIFYCAADELIRSGAKFTTPWNKLVIARVADTEERYRSYEKWDRAQHGATSINLETDLCVLAGLSRQPPNS